MKFSFREQKINFTMVLFLSPLFATTLLGKPVLAGKTSQSDKIVDVKPIPIPIPIIGPILENIFKTVNILVSNTNFNANYNTGQPKTLKPESAKSKFGFREAAVQLLKGQSIMALQRGKAVKRIENNMIPLDTFTKDFEQVADVLSILISPNKEVTITEINNLTKAVNNLRKSTYIVGEDMKNISKQVSSEEDLIAVKDMVKSIETATLLLENLTPQLNQIRLAISTSD
ncbi:hypothetical protein H6F62_09775 [Anabaena sp. FACHB-1391]|uniref:hypothetical protein n=1 Tax=Anabaena sp. FACHB-1391 TaxID=2692771 RepID=UPI00167FEF58|nr:hypothetical protein [Anabaena sp. FACHB-1391]MBD2269047.1 hypothetical protein [Anabaena sp. FACHB-1391]